MVDIGRHSLHVQAPEESAYTTPEAMRRVDDTLRAMPQLHARFNCSKSNGMPIQNPDGTWEVRIPVDDPMTVRIVKAILAKQFGLEIVREDPHN